jgi:hypothetical protein
VDSIIKVFPFQLFYVIIRHQEQGKVILMRKIYSVLFNVVVASVLPGIAGAAGTYYNNNLYQQRYGGGVSGNASMNRGYGARYGQQQSTKTTTTRTVMTKKAKSSTKQTSSSQKQGFVLGGGLSHEFASWNFDMKSAGSKLHYDNLAWNVIDGNVAYYFGDSTPMQVKVGARYGMQFDESPMVDDDISKGGYLAMAWTDENGNIVGYQTGHALSVGTSKGGNQMGFNASFGLTDVFQWGRVKMTPSIGYRYFKYKLTTEQNYGVAIDILESTDNHPYITCISGYLGEIQCDPFLLFYSSNGDITITGRVEDASGNISDVIQVPALSGFDTTGVSTGGTYYYEQSGKSHEYTTTWAGPYVAMDFEYAINSDNLIVGGIEIGLPTYTSEGNQPYRYDWDHPKSVEDSGSLGDAIHLGLNANWKTAITDSTLLTFGLNYDYYKVSGATAKTYLNSAYYEELYDTYVTALNNGGLSDYQVEMLNEELDTIDAYRSAGWTLESSGEIESLYKSMGIRLGVEVKF